MRAWGCETRPQTLTSFRSGNPSVPLGAESGYFLNKMGSQCLSGSVRIAGKIDHFVGSEIFIVTRIGGTSCTGNGTERKLTGIRLARVGVGRLIGPWREH